MTIAPLTDGQLADITVLVNQRRIEQVPVDIARSEAFLAKSQNRLSQLPLLTSTDVIFSIAYDAAHDVGEALLAAYGYRTRATNGQHEAVGRFMRVVLTDASAGKAAKNFDRLRRKRNQDHYSAEPISQADTDMATTVANTLWQVACELLAPTPQNH